MPTDGRITSLDPLPSALTSTDLLMVVQPGNASSGINYSVTPQQIASYVAGTAAGGSNTQVQYNSSGAFAGDPAFTWVGPNLRVGTVGTVGGLHVVGQTAGGVVFNAVASSAVWTFTLPSSAGTADLPLITDGLGTTAWTTLRPPGGGTGLAAYSTGDLLYASNATTLARLAAATANYLLASANTTSAPNWLGNVPATVGGTGLTAYTTGDLLYASNGTTLARLAAATTGFLLVSQGTSIAPAWASTAPIGSITFGDGSLGAPSIAFTNETTTGFYRIGTANIGIAGASALIASLGTSISTFSSQITIDRTTAGAVNYFTGSATGTSAANTGIGFRLITDAGTFSFIQYASGSAGNTNITAPSSSASTTRTVFLDLPGATATSGGNFTIRATVGFNTRFNLNGVTGVATFPSNVSATNSTSGTIVVTGGFGASENIYAGGSLRSSNATAGLGFSPGAGTTVTQGTSRTTGVTANAVCGAITLFSAAGTSTVTTFTVTNSAVATSDVVLASQRSGTDLYRLDVTNTTTGAFNLTFATTGGTATEQPVFNFAVIKAVTA